MIMNSDINKSICILFVHLSAIILENFKDLALIIPEILESIELHTYKFGLVYYTHVLGFVHRPSTVSNISKTAWPIKAKFYMEPLWVGGTKVRSIWIT